MQQQQNRFQNGANLDPMVLDYLMKKQNPGYRPGRAKSVIEELDVLRGREASPEYREMESRASQRSIDPALVSSLAQSAAQIGTLDGKAASTAPLDQFAAMQESRFNSSLAAREKAAEARRTEGRERIKNAGMLDEQDVNATRYEQDDLEKNRQFGFDKDKFSFDKDKFQRQFDADEAARKRDYGLRSADLGLRQRDQRLREDLAENKMYLDEMGIAREVQGVDAEGKPVANLVDRMGDIVNTLPGRPVGGSTRSGLGIGARDAKNPLDTAEKSEVVELSKMAAKQTAISNMIDQQLVNFKDALEKGDDETATNIGNGMLKALQSDFGPDALQQAEYDRLAPMLKYQVLNVMPGSPGATFGRNLKGFYEQASQKSNASRRSADQARQRVQEIYQGGYNQPSSQLNPKPFDKNENNEVERKDPRTGKIIIYDAVTKKPLREK